MTDSLGTFVNLWEKDGSVSSVMDGSQHTLDAEVSKYLETGRDSLIYISRTGGDTFVIKASRVASWRVSTPAGRRADELNRRLQKEENDALKAELGWVDDD